MKVVLHFFFLMILELAYSLVHRSSIQRSRTFKLQLDIFGLGPAEVVIIAGVAAFLYGPGRLKEQLREKGIKGTVVSKGFKAERQERIALMIEAAEKARKIRSWERINAAISIEDPVILKRLAEYEEQGGGNQE